MTPSTAAAPAVPPSTARALDELAHLLDGELRRDLVHRLLYATDASIHELIPVAVAFPRHVDDLVTLARVATAHRVPLTPRAAGTSLSGQTIGPGIVVDVGRHMRAILDTDPSRRAVRVQPGVIRDDLNRAMRPHGLYFGPDTSTANRCMIGGMIGNNSCGSHSIRYGTTRDHIRSIEAVFADGTRATLGPTSRDQWADLRRRDDRLGGVVRHLESLVARHAAAIRQTFPRPEVRRRNTGYALDDLADTWLGDNPDRDPDLARFLCGSEGTLALVAEATLNLSPVPRAEILVVAHFETIEQALFATIEAVEFDPAAVELIDKRTLDLSALNTEQARNRAFLVGDPDAILVIELYDDSVDDVRRRAEAVVEHFRARQLGYAWPVLEAPRAQAVWKLREAGLGVLMGAPGDVKPVTLVEDTAVAVADLPAYIRDFRAIMDRHDAECVYYAHASVGELHLRPELNFKLPEDIARGRAIAEEVADLVRVYRGSLSGEHGDGRVRSPFIERALGPDAVAWFGEVKRAFDPDGVLNPNVIVDPNAFEQDWRYHPQYREVSIPTEFAYDDAQGFQRMVERCNGAGVCRRSAAAGGTMCPSYMATLEERESTRGRANLFRHFIQRGPDGLFGSEELKDALDLCLSCKGCKSDCPASVDMARLKAEFTQGWMDRNGVPLRSRIFAEITRLGGLSRWMPGGTGLANWGQNLGLARALLGRWLGVHPARSLPDFAPRSLRAMLRGRTPIGSPGRHGRVCLFLDEFTDLYEPDIGLAAVELLELGGWEVVIPDVEPSGRTWLSKGFVREARTRIEANLAILEPLLGQVEAIVGVEPSAILTFRDEAIDLPRDPATRARARKIAARVTLLENFIADRAADGRWDARWTDAPAHVLLHGHCHQKAITGVEGMRKALSLPPNWRVDVIPSGCCGMAGSFGYEAEHYDTSMAVGELVLFPAIRGASEATILAAPGTSCRHQIHDGTGRRARHPIEILREAARPG